MLYQANEMNMSAPFSVQSQWNYYSYQIQIAKLTSDDVLNHVIHSLLPLKINIRISCLNLENVS
ncbi:MAG: hypothetical protein M3146_04725 [Thermoproteota archaeon]|nr:hypothetical protein [Thermoproteota archaeon]